MSSSDDNNNNSISMPRSHHPSPSAPMTPSANTISNSNSNERASTSIDTSTSTSPSSPGIQVMLRCDVCGHLVPEMNMEIHKASPRACQAGAGAGVSRTRTAQRQQHEQRVSVPGAQPLTQQQTQQPPYAPARPVQSTSDTSHTSGPASTSGNTNPTGAATAPFEFEFDTSNNVNVNSEPDDRFQHQSQSLLERNRNPYRHRPTAAPAAVASAVHPTTSHDSQTAPMEWSRDEPDTFLPTGEPVRRARVPVVPGMDVDVDIDMDAVARRESTDSTGSVLQVGDVVDLVNSSGGGRGRNRNSGVARGGMDSNAPTGVEVMDEDADAVGHWSCPRCTLHNPSTESVCEACNYSKQQSVAAGGMTNGVRAADPVRRDRLIAEPLFAERQQQQDLQQHPSYMTSGALLGGVLGVAGAYLRGRPLGSAALHGAMNGAVTGAVLQEFVPNRTPPVNNANANNRRSRNRNANANLPPAAAAAATDATPDFSFSPDRRGNNGPAAPQQVRVVRSRGPNGRVITTVYTSSSASSPVRGRFGGGGGQGNTVRRQGVSGQEDPMLAYIIQSLANSPGGRFDMVGDGAGGFGMPQDLDGMSYDQLLQRFGDGSENRGADEGTIRSLPYAAVQDPDKLPEDCRTCCICLEAFEAGMMRKTLPCLHGFHQKCIDKWLRTNGACPICKHHIGG